MSQRALAAAPAAAPAGATSRARLALMVLAFVLLWSSAFAVGTFPALRREGKAKVHQPADK